MQVYRQLHGLAVLPRLALRPTCLFCSTTAPPSEEPSEEPSSQSQSSLRDALYDATLKRVPEHGWTSIAVDAALRDLNLSIASAGMLPAGIATIAADFDARCNRDLATHLVSIKDAVDTDELDDPTDESASADEQRELPHEDSPPARAAYAIQYRLSLLDPYHQYWYQAIALRPRVARQSLRNRLLLADEIAAYAQYNSPNVCMIDRSQHDSFSIQ